MQADRTFKKKNNSGKSGGKRPRSSIPGGDDQGAKGRQSHARKNKINNVLEWMSDGFISLDAHMNYTYVNHRAGEILGRKPEDLVGKNLWEEYPEAKGSSFANAYMRAWETQQPVTFEGYFEPWGRWFETRIHPSKDELAVFFTELTERKRVEARSKYSEEMLNAIFEQSPLSVQVFSADGTSLRANRAWEDLWGSRREQLAGYNVLTDPQVKERGLLAYFEKALKGEIVFVPPMYYDPTEIGQKGGGRWTKAVIYPVKDASGKVREVVLTHEDITESKQAESNIRQYADIVENMQIGLYVLRLDDFKDDHSLRVVSANPAALQFSGATADEVVGKALEEGFPELREMGIPQKYAEVIRTQKAAEIEVVYYDDSQKLDTAYAVKAFPLPNDHLGVVFESITERRQAEEKVRESELRLRNIIDNEPECIKILDSAGSVLQMNPAGLAMIEADTIQSVLGKSVYPIVTPEFRPLFRDLTEKVFKGQSGELEFEIVGLKGTRRWLNTHAVPMRNEQGNVTELLGITRDVTERRRAEEALRQSEQRYRTVVENQAEFIVRWKPGGIRTFANEAYCRYFGLTQEQALSSSFVPLIHEEDRQGVEEKIARLQSGVTRIETEAHRVIKPDGSIGWQEWTDQAIYDEGGQLIEFQSIGRDITERKQVEEALHESEGRYRALFEDSPVSIWEEDFSRLKKQLDSLQAQGIADLRAYFISQPDLVYNYSSLIRILDVNKTAMQMYGARSKTELIENSEQVLSKGERENIIDDFIAIAEGRMSNSWEGGDETLLGEPIEISLKWLVAPGYEQDYSKVIVTVIDITERKRAESELQASEERFRQLAGNIQEVFWIKDVVAKKDLYISPAYEDVWGRRLEAQMENQNVFIESVLLEDREMVLATIEKQMQGKRTEMEYRITRPDGSTRWIWDRAFPIFDGSHSVKLVTGIAADITERKQAEAETLRHLAELQALYENGLAVGRLLSPQEIGERVIQTFTHYLSWHHVTVRLRRDTSDDLDLVAFSVPHLQEGEKEKVERNFNARINKVGQGMSGWVVQTGEPVRTGNVHMYPQYVNTYDAIQSGMYMPLKIGDRVIGCISVESEIADAFTAQDERLFATIANQAAVAFENARLYQAIQQELFDRKRAEEMLEHERNSLAQRVEERTADLQRAIESLARALRVKDEFLANMSHELRTPLNAILGLSESLAEQVAGSLNEKQLKYVTTISESGHHLLALINDILDLAKIEAGQITLDITRVDMELVCQASLRMVKQLAQKKNQEIELEIDHNFGLIWADERRLKQMIVNLLSNAVKFTPENKRIGLEVHGDKDENRVLITVWDEGIGIDDDDLAQLFKPFVQLDAGLARETSGTGLGLALVAQMARLHGGGVSVASIPEQGSRFTIVIPWEPALRADTIERLKVTGKFKAVKTDQRSQQTILLIEDTKEVVMLLRDYLELAGYKVITAEDGIEGITQARLLKPDLILMDLQMPRMDGIETTQKLRSETEFKHTPIIALTALAMQGDRERCLAAGMDEYISKPVNLKTLVKIIQGFLAGDSQNRKFDG